MNSVTALEPIPIIETSEPARESLPAASPRTRKPRVWTAFATFVVAAIMGQIAIIAGFVAVGIAIGIIEGAQGADAATIQAHVQAIVQQPLTALLLSLVPFQLGMTVVVLFAAWRSKEPFQQRLGIVPQTGRTFGGFKLTMMAAFTVSTALASVIFSSLFLGPLPANNPIAAVITDGSWWTITLLSIILSVLPALVEEALFRGYLQRRFLQRWSPAVAISVSALLFAILHMDSLQHVLAVVPLGLVTGLLAYRTNSVKPGMLVHAVHNTGAVGFGALATALTSHLGQEELGLLVIGTIGLLGLIGLPAVVSLLRSTQPQPSVETHPVPEPAGESLPVLSRELSPPDHASDSRLASQAV